MGTLCRSIGYEAKKKKRAGGGLKESLAGTLWILG